MIKRRFYQFEHSNKENPSDSAPSSSESELQGDVSETEEVDMEDADVEESNAVLNNAQKEAASSSSGYETEDSSASEVNLDSPANDEEKAAQISTHGIPENVSPYEADTTTSSHDPQPFDVKDCVLKRKSVFKCKLCPRIVCLSEDSLKAHLNSKKHARSEKLYKAGRLKLMLNDDGKIEGEDHPKSHPPYEGFGQQKRRSNRQWKGKTKRSKRTYGRK